MGWRHLFLKGDVLWTVCVVTVRWSIWGRNPCSSGNTVFLTGHLSNLFSGALEVDIYACRHCGKLEFYRADAPSLSERLQKE